MSKIIIVGKGGSGKDYLADKFVAKGFGKCVPYTTRPKRKGERNGIDYHFLTQERFDSFLHNGHFIWSKSYNEWWYGIPYHHWYNNNMMVAVVPPSFFQEHSLKHFDFSDCIIIYRDPPQDVRRKRLLERQDADSVDRRIAADELDFKRFDIFDIRITEECID